MFLIHCDEAGEEKLHFVYGRQWIYWDQYYANYKQTGLWSAKPYATEEETIEEVELTLKVNERLIKVSDL